MSNVYLVYANVENVRISSQMNAVIVKADSANTARIVVEDYLAGAGVEGAALVRDWGAIDLTNGFPPAGVIETYGVARPLLVRRGE